MTVNNIPAALIPGPLGTFDWQFGTDIHDAPDSSKKISIEWQNTINPGLVAFQLVRELYAWFGIEEDGVPYTETVGTSMAISRNKIIEMNNRPL